MKTTPPSKNPENPSWPEGKFPMADRLNGILEDICGAIGFHATCELVAWFGGASLYVPSTVTEEHPICLVIGLPAYRRLVALLGGETVSLPSNRQYDIARRNRAVVTMVADGYSDGDIATRYGVTRRQLRNIKRAATRTGVLPKILRSKALPQKGIAQRGAPASGCAPIVVPMPGAPERLETHGDAEPRTRASGWAGETGNRQQET
jgi:DNA-binding CsgD family transcriptional regulator